MVFLLTIFMLGYYYSKSNENSEYFKSHMWVLLLPYVVCVILLGDLFFSINNTAPSGKNVTKLVKVTDLDSEEEYYWNLLVDIFVEADEYAEGKYHEYTVYEVEGYVSPENGKVIDVEPDGFETLGQEMIFRESYND